jgi:glycosyltransferase involved in cell wall biosynthesis
LAALRGIGDILATEGIDVAHAHVSIVAPVGLAGAQQAQRRGVPTVVTFHSFIPATPVWARMVGGLLGANSWKAVFTAVSSRVASEVGPFASRHVFGILPNAIDAGFWTPAPPDVARRELVLLYAGRLQAKKRPMLVMQALRALHEAAPSLPCRLRIACSGPGERAMRAFASTHALGDRVEFLGWRSSSELRDIVRQSDVFLSPATRESFGIAALEARSAGLPVVAMRQSAVADFIDHERSGLLATSDRGFIDAVIRIATDEGLRAGIAAHNREVRPAFDWPDTIALHLAAYDRAREMMAGGGR